MKSEEIVVKIDVDKTLLEELREVRYEIQNLLKEIKSSTPSCRVLDLQYQELEWQRYH